MKYVSYDGDIAEIGDENGNTIFVRREILDGLWAGFKWSPSNQALHFKINHIQIDNQLPVTLFPTILYPVVSKAAVTDIRKIAFFVFEEKIHLIFNVAGKPFIELSVFKTQSVRSNTIQIK